MTMPPMPPSLEEIVDQSRREGFYEYAVRATEKRLGRVYKQLRDAETALAAARERIAELENESGEWCYLAHKYGTQTEAERCKDTQTLNGKITLAADLVIQGGERSIEYACMDLAKKLKMQLPKP